MRVLGTHVYNGLVLVLTRKLSFVLSFSVCEDEVVMSRRRKFAGERLPMSLPKIFMTSVAKSSTLIKKKEGSSQT